MMRNMIIQGHVNFLAVELFCVLAFNIKHSVCMFGSSLIHLVKVIDMLAVHHVLVV